MAQKEKAIFFEEKHDDGVVEDEVNDDSDILTSPNHHLNVVVDDEVDDDSDTLTPPNHHPNNVVNDKVNDDSDTLTSPVHHPNDVEHDEKNDDSDTLTSPNHHPNDVEHGEVNEDSDTLIVDQEAAITTTTLGQSLSPATPLVEEKVEDDEQEEISDSVLQHFLNSTMAEETTDVSVFAAAFGIIPTTTSISSPSTQQAQNPEGSSCEDEDMPDMFEDAVSIHDDDDDEAEVQRAVVFLDDPYSTQRIVQFLHAGLVATAGILYSLSLNQ